MSQNGPAHFGGPYVAHGGTPWTIFFPATIGGGLWAGVSYDPKLEYIFVNTMSLGDIGLHGGSPRFWDIEKKWPCNQPPWGELYAINARTGDIAWKVPFGSFPELEKLGIHDAGTPNIGGVTATAGGVLFAAGTADSKMRAFDSRNGKELWSAQFETGAHAVPITYQGRSSKQYVAVMVSGGGFIGLPVIPATLMVYALP